MTQNENQISEKICSDANMVSVASISLYQSFKKNVDVFQRNVREAKIFQEAIEPVNSNQAEIKAALKAGVNPNFKKKFSLLELAVMANDIDAVGLLINNHADVDISYVIKSPSTQMLDALLPYINTAVVDKNKRCVLHHAALSPFCLTSAPDQEDQTSWLVGRLVERGLNTCSRDKFGLYPHDYAALNANKRAYAQLRLLANTQMPDVDHASEDGKTALIRAVEDGNQVEVERLVEVGACLDLRDVEQRSCLSIAINQNDEAIVDLLIKAGAEQSALPKIKNEKQMLLSIKNGHLGSAYLAMLDGVERPTLDAILQTYHPRAIDVLGCSGADLDNDSYKALVPKLLPLAVIKSLPLVFSRPLNVAVPDSVSLLSKSLGKVKRIQSIIASFDAESSERKIIDEDEYFLNDLDAAGPCWLPLTLSVPTKCADRRMSMYSGPFYASKAYPWPLNGEGLPAEPIIQIDLRIVSDLKATPTSFGDGLLQVFTTSWNTSLIRVVPRTSLKDALDDAPTFTDPMDSSGEWIGEDGVVTHIVGFKGPYFSNCSIELDVDENQLTPLLKELQKLLSEISGVNDSGFHLFGSFYPVQYRPGEQPPTFFALDCEHGYSWGDSGTAQVQYMENTANDPPVIEFGFKWSCY